MTPSSVMSALPTSPSASSDPPTELGAEVRAGDVAVEQVGAGDAPVSARSPDPTEPS